MKTKTDMILDNLAKNHAAMNRQVSIYSVAADEIKRLRKKLDKALALTDTGSDDFREVFPPRSVGESLNPREIVPGWRVVEKIREALS